MHTRLLRYFDAIARHGSIRKAADAVHVAPSAVNRHLLELEAEIGEPLFERLPRGVRPTAAGEILLLHIRSTMRDYERARSEIGQLRTGARGRIVIVSIESALSDLLPDAIIEFARRFPRIEFSILGLTADAAVQAVADGTADLCVIFNPAPRLSLTQVAAADFPLGVIVAPHHPLASHQTVTLSHLVGHELVMADQSITIFREIEHVMSGLALRLPPRMTTSSISFMSAYVERGDAFSIMTPVGIGQQLKMGRLRFIPLQDRGIGVQRLIAGTADASMPVAVANFCQHLRNFMPAWHQSLEKE